jgi:hypothetical protein
MRKVIGFLYFYIIISGSMIKIVYFVGLMVSVACWLLAISDADFRMSSYIYVADGKILIPTIILLLGNVIWRIGCECLIILFSIHENLVAINKKTV